MVAAARESLRGLKQLTRAGHVDPLRNTLRGEERDGQAVLTSHTLVSGSVGFTPLVSESAGFGPLRHELGRLQSSGCKLW